MNTRGILCFLLLVFLGTAPTYGQVQEDQLSVDLLASMERVHLLTPASPVAAGTLELDSAPSARIIFGSASKTLDIDLTAPDGTQIPLGAPATALATSTIFPDPQDPATSGANYLFTLTNVPAGTWSYEIRETQPLASKRAVLLNVISSSKVRSAILGGGEDYRLDREIHLALVTVEGSTLLKTLSITAEVKPLGSPSATAASVTFHDDGLGSDEVAGDGMFTAALQPGATGEYQVSAMITGQTSQGEEFERDVVAGFRVQPVRANLDSSFTDRGIDLDGDGLLDQIGVTPSVNVVDAGEYSLTVVLRGSNGQTLAANRVLSLDPGDSNPEVLFSTADIRGKLAVPGPYDVAEVRLDLLSVHPAATVDAVFELGPTAAYALDDFQRPPIQLVAGAGAAGIDVDGNGRFEFLEVTLPVSVLKSGQYQWSARLVDQNGREIAFASGSATLEAGTSPLTLRFDGLLIGQNGVNGPFFVRNLIVFGEDESLTADEPFTTPAFRAAEFEGFTGAAAVEVPALGPLGMTVLAVLLAAAASWLLRRRRAA